MEYKLEHTTHGSIAIFTITVDSPYLSDKDLLEFSTKVSTLLHVNNILGELSHYNRISRNVEIFLKSKKTIFIIKYERSNYRTMDSIDQYIEKLKADVNDIMKHLLAILNIFSQ